MLKANHELHYPLKSSVSSYSANVSKALTMFQEGLNKPHQISQFIRDVAKKGKRDLSARRLVLKHACQIPQNMHHLCYWKS